MQANENGQLREISASEMQAVAGGNIIAAFVVGYVAAKAVDKILEGGFVQNAVNQLKQKT